MLLLVRFYEARQICVAANRSDVFFVCRFGGTLFMGQIMGQIERRAGCPHPAVKTKRRKNK